MGWRDLLTVKEEDFCAPWLGGRKVQVGQRVWTITGQLPEEHGWVFFTNNGRTATRKMTNAVAAPVFVETKSGYLVGDRFADDHLQGHAPLRLLLRQLEPVHLVEQNLDRFARVGVGRTYADGPLIFIGEAFPFGPEPDVRRAFEDELPALDQVKGVPPALEAAFRLETFQRAEATRRRAELAAQAAAEQARQAAEARRAELATQLGDAAGRRRMAAVDFTEAAKAALAVGGATYLDHRLARAGEYAVKFRFRNRRFECLCDDQLRIVDSGICLTDHETGEKGDRRFTLESLPAVIAEADDDGKLVVYRHV